MRLAVCLMLFLAVPALAERPPQFRKGADLVVSGTVEKLGSTEKQFGGDGVMTLYAATIKVETLEKGKGVKIGDRITATWFHVTKRPTKPFPGAYGQGHAVKEKDKATFWLMGDKPPYAVIYNRDGVEKAKK